MKKLCCLVFLLFLLAALPLIAQADGKCGDNLHWTYDAGAQQLTITGTGPMYDYTDSDDSPFPKGALYRVFICSGSTSIGALAFADRRVTTVSIPNTVKRIGQQAFSRCWDLTQADLPDSVTEAGIFAFNACTALKTVRLSKKLREIPDGMFLGCNKIESVAMPDSITAVGTHAFYGCSSLSQVSFSQKLQTIGDGAFARCKLTYVHLHGAVTTIGNLAFSENANLYAAIIPKDAWLFTDVFDGCTAVRIVSGWGGSVQAYADSCANLTFLLDPDLTDFDFTLPAGIDSLYNEAFAGGAARGCVCLGESVQTVSGGAFRDCTGLELVYIGNSGVWISDYAFSGCSGITLCGGETVRDYCTAHGFDYVPEAPKG